MGHQMRLEACAEGLKLDGGRRAQAARAQVAVGKIGGTTPNEATKPDQDIHKGAVEDETPNEKNNAPALDGEGLPNDKTKIRGNAISAREDGTQG